MSYVHLIQFFPDRVPLVRGVLNGVGLESHINRHPQTPVPYVIRTQEDLKELSEKERLTLYNFLATRSVSHFKNKAEATERCWGVLNGKLEEEDMATKTKAKEAGAAPEKSEKKTPAKKAVAKAVVKTPNKFDEDGKITILAKENPRRAGTNRAKQFEKYKNGMTVGDAREAGLTTSQLRRDVRHGHISIG